MKPLNIFLYSILLVLVVIGISFSAWFFQKKTIHNIYVLDKTISSSSFDGHKSFFWILNYNRYTKKSQMSYSYKNDYYGIIPNTSNSKTTNSIRTLRLFEILSIIDEIDVAYYTDTYSIINKNTSTTISNMPPSKIIYGGLNQNDYLLLNGLRRKNKLIITEYNFFDYPTSDLIRKKTETLFSIYNTEWKGCSFKSLKKDDTEVPQYFITLYEQQNNAKWNFQGGGILLINHDNKIIILEEKKDLKTLYPRIITTTYAQDKYKLPVSQNYNGWFDVIKSSSVNTQIASFELNVSQQGADTLKKYDIPSSFPAIVEHLKYYKFYYFAGDFAKREISYNSSYFKGIVGIKQSLGSSENSTQNAFFWRFYYPLISNILKNNLTTK
jgi:hypothetical protein